MKKLENKVAFVTGCAGGNGLGTVKTFVKYGAKVIMTDVQDKLFAAAEELQKEGYDVLPIKMDVTDLSQVKAAAEKGVAKYGRIDVLVNNAGVTKLVKYLDASKEIVDFMFKVNLFGAMNCCTAILPYMVKQNYGRVVNVSSVTGPYVSDEGNIIYGITKAGVIGLTKGLALEFAKNNITVNAICPGYIRTPMSEKVAKETNADLESVMAGIAKTIPLQRLGTPLEIGELCAFLGSDESAYITGIDVVIDGGAMLPETNVIGI